MPFQRTGIAPASILQIINPLAPYLGGSCRAARSLVPCAAAAALGVPPPLTPQYPPNIPPTPQFYENLQILPLGNVRLFRRIRKNDTLFLKMCVFREHLVNVCAFR